MNKLSSWLLSLNEHLLCARQYAVWVTAENWATSMGCTVQSVTDIDLGIKAY